jgi:allophanate hydrolase
VPACRTLDCISVFSLTVDDAMTALAAMAGPTAPIRFSRDRPLGAMSALPAKLRLGVPRNGQLIFFGDRAPRRPMAKRSSAGPARRHAGRIRPRTVL